MEPEARHTHLATSASEHQTYRVAAHRLTIAPDEHAAEVGAARPVPGPDAPAHRERRGPIRARRRTHPGHSTPARFGGPDSVVAPADTAKVGSFSAPPAVGAGHTLIDKGILRIRCPGCVEPCRASVGKDASRISCRITQNGRSQNGRSCRLQLSLQLQGHACGAPAPGLRPAGSGAGGAKCRGVGARGAAGMTTWARASAGNGSGLVRARGVGLARPLSRGGAAEAAPPTPGGRPRCCRACGGPPLRALRHRGCSPRAGAAGPPNGAWHCLAGQDHRQGRSLRSRRHGDRRERRPLSSDLPRKDHRHL